MPSYQMSPSFGEVGAVPERIRREAVEVVEPSASTLAVAAVDSSPENPFPFTCSFEFGVAVSMPTLPDAARM